MLGRRYVVDTNVITHWLLKPDGLSAKIIRSLELELFTSFKAVDELWRHRSDWSKKLVGVDVGKFVDSISYYVKVVPVPEDSAEMTKAREVMGDIDPEDVEFLALALVENADIWSHDQHFKKQSLVKVVTSEHILKSSYQIPTLWEVLKDEYLRRHGRMK